MKTKRVVSAALAFAILCVFNACAKSPEPDKTSSAIQGTASFAAQPTEPIAQTTALLPLSTAASTALTTPTTKRFFRAASANKSKSLIVTDIYARSEGISQNALAKSPATKSDFIDYFHYFIGNRLFELKIPVNESTIIQAGEFSGIADAASKCALEICPAVSVLYPECASSNNLSLTVTYFSGSIIISRKAPLTKASFDEETARYNQAVAKAKSVVSSVTGALPPKATDYDIAVALIKWLADNCVYDSAMSSAGFTAYGALVNGRASCVGYTAGCAMLLKATGITCVEVNSESHSWLALKLGGKIYWADPTFADGEPGYDQRYFPSIDLSIYDSDGQHSPELVDYEETKRLWKKQ